jgi:hypothetical protein
MRRDADEPEPLLRRQVCLAAVRPHPDELPGDVEEVAFPVDAEADEQLVGQAVLIEPLGDRGRKDRTSQQPPEELDLVAAADTAPL